MTDLILHPPPAIGENPPQLDVVRGALLESRQRWRHLVGLAADLAFETDDRGRFVFILPATALGWPNGALVGQPSELIVGDDGTSPIFNPFRPTQEIKRRRCWLRRFDGRLAMMAISAEPLHDTAGQICGARGIGLDMTETDNQSSALASRLRRGEVLDHILARIGQETEIDRMMDSGLWSMVHALSAEAVAVYAALSPETRIEPIHECGPGADAVRDLVERHLVERGSEATTATALDGRRVLVVPCLSRFGTNPGLAFWRHPASKPWEPEDIMLATSAASIIRMILDYEAIQQELAQQARTDPLTGLLNRRSFGEEMHRQVSRLDREALPGTLIYIDVDSFKPVNDMLGHAMGDMVLTCLSDMLRKLVRPMDLVARLGGDEFAVWLSGADHMTAAERADSLCRAAPAAFQAALQQFVPGLGLSVGIATRAAGTNETLQELARRADFAMYEVKRGGRGHWRVSLLDAVP